jgi:hypothetical protein
MHAAAAPPQCLSLDPACEIPDFAAKEAQQIVRDVIKEVHGPFFNSEVRACGCRVCVAGWQLCQRQSSS